jgi:hypothetical protein
VDELSTPPILEPIRPTDSQQPRAHAPPHRSEKRPRAQNHETETNEQDEPLENGEPKHHVDISV